MFFETLSPSPFFFAYAFAAALILPLLAYLFMLKLATKYPRRRARLVPIFLIVAALALPTQSPVPFAILGFLLPVLWESQRRLWKLATTALGFAALLNLGDILALAGSTASALLGYALYRLLFRNSLFMKRAKTGLQLEPFLYLAASLLGTLLLFNPHLLVPEVHPLARFLPEYVIDPTVTPISLEAPLASLLEEPHVALTEELQIQLVSLEGETVGHLTAHLKDLKLSDEGATLVNWHAPSDLSQDAKDLLQRGTLHLEPQALLTGNQIRETTYAETLTLRHYEQPLELDLPHLQSPYAFLMELERGRVLVDQQEGFRYPASMTKVMTALLVLEHFQNLDELVPISPEMLLGIPWYATIAGFELGTPVTARDLVYGIVLPSGADATQIAAVAISQSVEGFVELMNNRARELGMLDTRFVNPVGLHDNGHTTTLSDLATLFAYAWDVDGFQEVITARQYVSSTGLLMESTLFNHPLDFELENGTFLGGRTGFTFESGRCLISIAYIGGRHFILATGGAPNTSLTTAIEDALYVFRQL